MNEDYLKSILENEDTHRLNDFILKNKNKIVSKKINKTTKNQETKDKDHNHILVSKDSLIVEKSSIHGYGIFGKVEIAKNSIIEKCNLIELEFRDKYHKDSTILNYSYAISGFDDDSAKHGSRLFLLTGNGMLYNHCDTNNAKWNWSEVDRTALLIAMTNIPVGTEITIDYGFGYWNRNINVKN